MYICNYCCYQLVDKFIGGGEVIYVDVVFGLLIENDVIQVIVIVLDVEFCVYLVMIDW